MESLESGAEQRDAGIGKLASTLNSSFEQINQQAQAYDNSSTLAQAQTIENNIGGAVNAMLAQLGNANLAITPYTDMNKTIDNATTQALYTKYMDAYQFVITNESNPIIAGINQTLAASGTQFTNLGAVYNAQMGLLFQTVSNQSISGALTQVYNTATQTQDPETGMNLSQSLATLKAGSSKLSSGISTVKAGIGTLDELTANTPLAAPTTVCQALNALISGSAQVNEGAGQLKAGLSKLTANNDTLNSGMSSAVEGAKQLDAGADQLTDANNGVPALVTGANQLKAGLGQLVESTPELTTGVNALNDGAKQLKIGTAQLNEGAGALALGVAALDTGANQLKDGTNALNDGAGALADGVAALDTGANQLKDGTNALNDGAGALADGVQALDDGANQLKDGIIQVNDGIIQVNDGAIELADGTITLKDGMIQFNDEGIEKITKMLGIDAPEITETLKKVAELGKNYQSFAGKADDIDGTVTFIYKTDGITK